MVLGGFWKVFTKLRGPCNYCVYSITRFIAQVDQYFSVNFRWRMGKIYVVSQVLHHIFMAVVDTPTSP